MKKKRVRKDAACNKINLCDNGEKSDLEDSEINIRHMYQLNHQEVFSDDDDRNKDRMCNMISDIEKMNLRKPSNEEIDRITVEMVAHVHHSYSLRKRTINNVVEKASGIFIKDITYKMGDRNKENNLVTIKIKDNKNKKWELKNKVQFQGVEIVEVNTLEKKINLDVIKQMEEPAIQV